METYFTGLSDTTEETEETSELNTLKSNFDDMIMWLLQDKIDDRLLND